MFTGGTIRILTHGHMVVPFFESHLLFCQAVKRYVGVDPVLARSYSVTQGVKGRSVSLRTLFAVEVDEACQSIPPKYSAI